MTRSIFCREKKSSLNTVDRSDSFSLSFLSISPLILSVYSRETIWCECLDWRIILFMVLNKERGVHTYIKRRDYKKGSQKQRVASELAMKFLFVRVDKLKCIFLLLLFRFARRRENRNEK